MSWDLREPWKRSQPVFTSDSGAASPCDDAVSDVDAESNLSPASPGTNVGYIAMLSEILLIVLCGSRNATFKGRVSSSVTSYEKTQRHTTIYLP